MKITRIKTFIVDGAFRPWTFVKIETSDDGVVGWGDCTDWGAPGPIAAMVERLGCPPLRTTADLETLAEEVRERGFTALKTNIFSLDDHPLAAELRAEG